MYLQIRCLCLKLSKKTNNNQETVETVPNKYKEKLSEVDIVANEKSSFNL